MGAKTYNVDLSHGGGKIAKKPGESKGGRVHSQPPLFIPNVGFMTAKPLTTVIEMKGKFS
jgi:hypothetical protein